MTLSIFPHTKNCTLLFFEYYALIYKDASFCQIDGNGVIDWSDSCTNL